MTRLDILVANFANMSREAAKELIIGGNVRVGGMVCTKAGAKFPEDIVLMVDKPSEIFVSRGGFKLQKALQTFDIKLDGKVCLDIGASTGGFTDCMLRNGAKHVIAIENGYGQLAQILQQDERVISIENTDIRNFRLNAPADFAACDLSFISISKVAASIAALLKLDAQAVFLIKPQFEAGPGHVGKQGVVKNPKIHVSAINKAIQGLSESGLASIGLDFSPISGANGNIEYLAFVHANSCHCGRNPQSHDIEKLVRAAFSALKEKP